jgi:hypothetical protein
MLRIPKPCPGLYALCVLTLLSVTGSFTGHADDEVPAGFKVVRYQKVWERNPFTLVTPAVQQAQPTVFDKLILLSWLNDGGQDVVFVQNTETNEVQKVTKDPNSKNLRLVGIHRDMDPKKAEAVLANGAEQGSVKFRLEMPTAGPQVAGGQLPAGGAGAQGKLPGMPGQAGTPRQMQMPQNAQQAMQQAARPGTAQPAPGTAQPAPGTAQLAPGTAPMQPENGTMPPRASEVRRKRITPPPSNEQPVAVPAPNQSSSNQAQLQ